MNFVSPIRGTAIDRFTLFREPTLDRNRNVEGKARVTPSPLCRKIGIFGQSLMPNQELTTPRVPAVPERAYDLGLHDGIVRRGLDPFLSGSGMHGDSEFLGGSICVPYIDYLDEHDAVAAEHGTLMLNFAVGATNLAAWAPGGRHNKSITVAVWRMLALGIGDFDVIHIGIGEADAHLGSSTSHVFSMLMAIIGSIRDAGSNAPVLINRESIQNGVTETARDRVRAGQIAATNPALNSWPGADVDAFVGANRSPTNPPHLSDERLTNVGRDMARAAVECWAALAA